MDMVRPETSRLDGGTPVLPFGGDVTVPTRLGRYEDLRPFAAGGMGVICRAWQREPEREVAIKVLLAGPQATPERKARFQREIRIAANLDHPGLVPVFDAGEQDGWLYFVMPFLENAESLLGWAVSHGLVWRERVELLIRSAEVVAVLHRQGLLHRDLKPGNILVDRHGEIRLLDFGLAMALDSAADETRLTQEGGVVGTPAYFSPEQAAGVSSRELTPATDVYSLAVVTYELVTGCLPYAVDGALLKVLRAIQDERPTPPSTHVPDLSPTVERILLNALSKDPTQRPADAGEYASALRSAVQVGAETQLTVQAAPPRRRPVRALAVTGLVVLAAGALVVARIYALRPPAGGSTPQEAHPPAPVEGDQNRADVEPPESAQPVKPPDPPAPQAIAPAPARMALLAGDTPPELRTEWRAKTDELRSATGPLMGKGALLFRLPPRARMQLRAGDNILHDVDGATQEAGCYHRAPGAPLSVDVTRPDGTTETLEWTPVAGRADTLAPAPTPPR